MTTWIITIKKPYIDSIIDGSKWYELRTRIPKLLKKGDRIFVVQSGSKGKVVISFDVAYIYRDNIAMAWCKLSRYMGIEFIDYQKYTQGRPYIYMIKIQNVKKFDNCPNISNIGLRRSPQWFCHITECQANFLNKFHCLDKK